MKSLQFINLFEYRNQENVPERWKRPNRGLPAIAVDAMLQVKDDKI